MKSDAETPVVWHTRARPGAFQTEVEREAGQQTVEIFQRSSDSIEDRLATFPRYVRRAQVTRFLALYELFRRVLPVKGSIIECGVFRGFSLMSFAKISAVLEPNNLTRRIYGFDSFEGFPQVTREDHPETTATAVGDLASASLKELRALIDVYDRDRFLGHIPKVQLIEGDLTHTLPQFVEDNPHLMVSLLFLDVDLYEPTKVALETVLPRMPSGAVLAFDELDNPAWPGETQAALETVGLRKLPLRRFEFDPYIAYAEVP